MSAALKIVIILVLAGLLLGAASLLSTQPRITGGQPQEKVPKLDRKTENIPDLSAEAALIKRLKTREVLFERNAASKLPIASLTKLMTALILAETAGPLEKIEFSNAAKEIGEPDDKRSSAQAGERIRAEDVLKMLLISSDNDAAYAAAEHAAIVKNPALAQGFFQERAAFFTELMNQRAGELALANTNFANPAGRDDPNNFSTAEDLAKLAEFIEKNRPELWAVSRMREAFVFGQEGQRYSLVNTNPLLEEFPAIYGSKTGFDDQAKGALLILYQLGREELIAIVLLKSSDRFYDGRQAIQWLETNFVLQ